jgi:hypothetical protein
MDWFTNTTQVDSNGEYVTYPKIWILNREGLYAKDSLYTDSAKMDLDSLLAFLLDTLKFPTPNLDSLVAVIIDTIKIDTITASNLGGIGLYKNKVGSDLRFKGLNAGANINIDTTNASYLRISSNPKIDSLMMPLLDSFFVEMRENISMGDLGNGTMNYHAKFKMMEGGAAVPKMVSASKDGVTISSNPANATAWYAFSNNASTNSSYTYSQSGSPSAQFQNNGVGLQPANNKIELIIKFAKAKTINGYKFDAGSSVIDFTKTFWFVNPSVQCVAGSINGNIYKIGNYPKNFKFLGSNDSTTWVELDNVTNYSTNFTQRDTAGFWWPAGSPSTNLTPTQYATQYCNTTSIRVGGVITYTRNGAYTKLSFSSPQNIKKYMWYKLEITSWEGDQVNFDYFQLYEQAGVTVADSRVYETGTTTSDTVISLAPLRSRSNVYGQQLVNESISGIKIKNMLNNYFANLQSAGVSNATADVIYRLPSTAPVPNQYLKVNSFLNNSIEFGWGTDQVGAAGETNTALNIGGSFGWFSNKNGATLQFKGVTAGQGIFIADSGTYLTISNLITGGEANTASSLGGISLVGNKVGTDLRFKGLQAGTGISINSSNSNYLEISATGGSGGGETNTASNVGSGHGIYKEKISADLRFKSLVAGSNITIDNSDANQLTISASGGGGGGGEINTITNLGTGYGIYRNKIGTDLKLRSLVAGSNISIDTNANHITISSTGGGGGSVDLSNYVLKLNPTTRGVLRMWNSSDDWINTISSETGGRLDIGIVNSGKLTLNGTDTVATLRDIRNATLGITGTFKVVTDVTESGSQGSNFYFEEGLLKSVTPIQGGPNAENIMFQTFGDFVFENGRLIDVLNQETVPVDRPIKQGIYIVPLGTNYMYVQGVYDIDSTHITFMNLDTDLSSYIAHLENETVPGAIRIKSNSTGTFPPNNGEVHLWLTGSFNGYVQFLKDTNIATADLIITPTNGAPADTIKITLVYQEPDIKIRFWERNSPANHNHTEILGFNFDLNASPSENPTKKYVSIINRSKARVTLTLYYVELVHAHNVRFFYVNCTQGLNNLIETPLEDDYNDGMIGYILLPGDSIVFAVHADHDPYFFGTEFTYMPFDVDECEGRGFIFEIIVHRSPPSDDNEVYRDMQINSIYQFNESAFWMLNGRLEAVEINNDYIKGKGFDINVHDAVWVTFTDGTGVLFEKKCIGGSGIQAGQMEWVPTMTLRKK